MALVKCPECNGDISTLADSCPHCGYVLKSPEVTTYTQPQPIIQPTQQKNTVTCPRCKSANVLIQREQKSTVGVSQNKVVIEKEKESKGCMYWLLVGWWLQPMIWLFVFPFKLLFGGFKTNGNLSYSKTNTKTVGVCQDCGKTWTIY